jgi:P-type E1-E2 ATPase
MPARFPKTSIRLVKAFQEKGHIVGVCGDGANDAPALRQAQMGLPFPRQLSPNRRRAWF